MVEGQINLVDAVERTISFDNPDGRVYQLDEQTATLLVRPRGWHLPEEHVAGRRRSPSRRRCSTSACTSSTTRGG